MYSIQMYVIYTIIPCTTTSTIIIINSCLSASVFVNLPVLFASLSLFIIVCYLYLSPISLLHSIIPSVSPNLISPPINVVFFSHCCSFLISQSRR